MRRSLPFTILAFILLLVGILALSAPVTAQGSAPSVTLPVTHTVTLTAIPVDASDYQTTAPCTAATWATSDATKATVAGIADAPLSAMLVPVAPGAVTVTATCGSLTQTLLVQVVGPPVALRIGIGAPVVKPSTP